MNQLPKNERREKGSNSEVSEVSRPISVGIDPLKAGLPDRDLFEQK
jgi:hypothetical protein